MRSQAPWKQTSAYLHFGSFVFLFVQFYVLYSRFVQSEISEKQTKGTEKLQLVLKKSIKTFLSFAVDSKTC